MPLVDGKELIERAIKGHFAIPSFGFTNLECAIAALEAAEETNAPIILASTQEDINYAGQEQLATMAVALAKNSKVPIALHFNHGNDLQYHKKAIELGYTSLMVDGSMLEFNENVEITNKVIEMAKNKNISIEAKIGNIRNQEDFDETDQYTTLEEAIQFIKENR